MNAGGLSITLVAALVTALLWANAAVATDAALQPAENTALRCSALTALDLPATRISAATLVPAGPFNAPGSAPGTETAFELPAFCRVEGMSEPAVNFEVWLPVRGWTGRFNGVGNGGMAGSISYGSMAYALNRGSATVSTDTGHKTSDVPFDASWAAGRPDLIEDFGHRALHLATVHGKAITAAFYGRAHDFAYYTGCSKGGQQGLMEAQRYPDDYDGLLVGNPAHDWTRFYAGAHLWYSLATLAEPESYLPPEKVPALGAAVNAACDELDGVADGVLMNPLECSYDPAELSCPTGEDRNDCLTPAQVKAVQQIWSGVRRSDGSLVFPGLVPGGEAAPGGWELWVTGSKPFSSLHWLGGEGFFRHFVFEDPDWDFRTFDFDRDLDYALDKVGHAVDADDPDLGPLRDGGAKLIVYHGLADADISPLGSINYYEAVLDTLASGDRTETLEAVQDFFRLFLVPGLGHCFGGPGPDQLEALAALEAWVERDEAPAQILAHKVENGKTVRSLPLCPYPAAPVWDREGDPMASTSYRCRSD